MGQVHTCDKCDAPATMRYRVRIPKNIFEAPEFIKTPEGKKYSMCHTFVHDSDSGNSEGFFFRCDAHKAKLDSEVKYLVESGIFHYK